MARGMEKMHTEHSTQNTFCSKKASPKSTKSTLLNNKTKLTSTPEKCAADRLETVSLHVTPSHVRIKKWYRTAKLWSVLSCRRQNKERIV